MYAKFTYLYVVSKYSTGGTMGLHHSFTSPYQGQAFLCVKKWFEAQISGILPNVF